ncbi:ribosome biogenesis GTP-binding protein YihA/YsxC [Blattabacterium cuenoti]|uniref:ribosome biogenesis GTP-binding protein YihA/YsxC n=1 Tax=Blattabacterium cuenoti TaxID=1653831 RepID=UPI00163CB5F1|nr:ribosome biogenesis GTP-binding protein YihA/YsxC [Blattabacterium cuenoti]
MKNFFVKFEYSVTDLNQLINSIYPEYACIGRSNVGKSSFINFILGNIKIAKVSSFPGKTKYINFFFIDNKWKIVDLPGYGFSRLSKFHKQQNNNLINNYIFNRKNLVCLFVIIDSRLIVQKSDLNLINKLIMYKIYFCIVFTKIDKLNYKILDKHINICKNVINKFSNKIFFFIKNKDGRKKIIQHIKNLNKKFYIEKLKIPNS